MKGKTLLRQFKALDIVKLKRELEGYPQHNNQLAMIIHCGTYDSYVIQYIGKPYGSYAWPEGDELIYIDSVSSTINRGAEP